jgi:hypothetical protein
MTVGDWLSVGGVALQVAGTSILLTIAVLYCLRSRD